MKRTSTIKVVCLVAVLSLALSACNQPEPTVEATRAVLDTVVPGPTPTLQPTPGPSPTPLPLANPILVDRAPVRGEELQLDQPVVLTFDQPMDRASVEQSIQIEPRVEGAFEWTRENVVSFKPAQGWERASRYSVTLGDAARSAKGLSLARPESFNISTVGYLEVAQTIPANDARDVTADTRITVLFNRPVVSLTAIGQQASLPTPVTFEPPIAGQGEWLNTSIYLFRPSQPLVAGVNYTGRVAAGLQDTTGALLQEDFSWTFSVAAPTVKFISPEDTTADVDLRRPISITFSQKMDHASAEAAFSIDPPVQGSFRWGEEVVDTQGEAPRGEQQQIAVGTVPQPMTSSGEVMAFVPEEDYQRGTLYKVEIKAGAKALGALGADGSQTQNARTFSFRSIENPGVASTQPAAGESNAETMNGFSIRFTAPVLPETIIPNLRFEPVVTLTRVYTYYDPLEKRFFLNVNLEPSTRYQVTIGGGIGDKYGVTIGQDTVVQFTTGPLMPFAVLQTAGQVGTYNANRPTRLFATYRNVSRLDFELSPLTPDQFHLFTGADNAFENIKQFRAPEGQGTRRWTMQTAAALNEAAFVEVPLAPNEGGLAPGIYLLTLTAPEAAATVKYYEPARHILVVTNLHVALKQGDREALAWVTDLMSGQPVAGLPVSFRNRTFAEIGTGVTGPDGQLLVKFPAVLEEYQPLYALVGEPGALTFSVGYNRWDQGINPWDFSLQGQFGSTRNMAYLYTDRPIYLPGQMVYFKGVVRAEDDARYSVAPGLTGVDVTINNEQGQQVFSTTIPLNASGTFSGEFALDNAAATGFYFLQTCLPAGTALGHKGNGLNTPALPVSAAQEQQPQCRSYGVSFQVATYRQPEFEVAVSTDKTDVLAGDTLKATVNAKYFFGGNVANARVQWTVYARDFIFDRYKGPGNYSFGDYDFFIRGVGFNEQVANGSGATDASGNLEISIPADISQRKTSAVFAIEVSVTDVNDQSVSARTEAYVHKSDYYMGIAPEDYVSEVGAETRINVISVDWQGQPIPDKPATLSFYQREWFTTQEEDQFGNASFTSVPSDTLVTTATVQTGDDGKTVGTFMPEEGGEYRLVVTGQTDPAPVAANSIWVSSGGEYVSWRVNNNDRIELKTDRQAYRVGDVVKLLVPSPFSGTVNALLSVERGRIISSTVIQLTSNSEILEIPVDASFAPNAFVSVLLVKGVDQNNPVPAYKVGYAGFQVDPGQFALNIEVKADRATYAPRDTVTYDIRVTDAQSNPVQAELSLALVDKAVLSLADPNSQPIMDAFYGPRGLGIRTADSLSVNVDRITARIIAENAKGGGGGGLAGLADGLFVRQNFKDTAFWSAVVNTDVEGRAQVQVTLPDNLTTWRLDARALTADTKVGQANNEIVSTKPLLVRAVTPRFFVVGDTATLGAVVNNNTSGDIEAEVSLDVRGVTLANPAPQQVTVQAGGTARVDWQITVDQADSAELTFSVKGGGLEDSSKPGLATAPNQGIPILRYAAPETVATAGDLSEAGNKLELIALPPRLDTGQGRLDIRVDPALAAVIKTGERILEAHEYDSAETAASRLLVAASMGDAQSVDSQSKDLATRAIQRLLGSQHGDGGWGWWITDNTNNAVTAYVLLALAHAQAAGYSVDVNALTRAREYLLSQLVPVDQQPSQANLQALILFALTEAGVDDSGRLGALYENREALNYAGRALLAMSLNKINEGDTRVSTLLSDITSGAVAGPAGVMWQERELDNMGFGSNTRSTAIVLNALARLDPNGALTSNVVRWLMVAREGDTWETNQEIAWAVLGLSAWQEAVGERDADYTWRVTLNGQAALNGQASADKLTESSELSVEVARLVREQANQLVFERGAGDGRMYYTARLHMYLPADEVKALNRGIVIARKYELADCEPEPGQPCDAVTGAAVGQNVRVRLTIVAPNDLYFVRVTDPLPGGAEAVDTSLKTSQQIGTETTVQEIGSETGWGWWWFSHTELRDDHAAMFASYLPAGTYEYTYVIRPSIAGAFKVMPASVEQTYFPETFGRSDGAQFTITK